MSVDTVLAFTRVLGVSPKELVWFRELQPAQGHGRVNRNARTAKLQEIFERLPSQNQRSVLRHAQTLWAREQGMPAAVR